MAPLDCEGSGCGVQDSRAGLFKRALGLETVQQGESSLDPREKYLTVRGANELCFRTSSEEALKASELFAIDKRVIKFLKLNNYLHFLYAFTIHAPFLRMRCHQRIQ
jgi:hypothetical protein